MESLSIRERNPALDQSNSAPGSLYRIDSLKVVTTIKHRMVVRKVLDLIEDRLYDPPTLGELARLAGLSRSYFSPIFKEVVGMRFQDYLSQTRINKAKDLLSDMNLTIKQVAYKVGFRDPDYFSRTFKKKTGMTPTDWKLMNIENFSTEKDHNRIRKSGIGESPIKNWLTQIRQLPVDLKPNQKRRKIK